VTVTIIGVLAESFYKLEVRRV